MALGLGRGDGADREPGPALGLGWLLARRQFRESLLNTLCLSPLVLPLVVTGWLLPGRYGGHRSAARLYRWAAVIAAAAVGFPLP